MNKKLLRIIAAALLLLAAYIVTKTTEMSMTLQLAIFLIPYLVAGYDVLIEAVEGIMEGDPFDENFLMAVATIGALGIGFLPGVAPEFAEAVFVMLFFQVGELFEHYAEDRSRKSIAKLMDIRPDTAYVERGGTTVAVSPEEVAVGETIRVKPGEKIPLDGRVTDGSSSLNTVALTGESMPRDVGVGDEVISGCINLSGLLKVRVNKVFSESTAAKILRLVEESSEKKSRSENFITKFARIYTPIVVFLALGIAILMPLLADSYSEAFPTWLYRALTFLVVSCPCALVISIPLTFFAGIGGASAKGILIKGGNYMDALSRLSTVVFDKTGTLTQGVFAVDAVHPDMPDKDELLHLAAHVERFSNHPIAAALREAYPHEHDNCSVENIKEVAGQGVQATINGKTVCVGNEKMMESVGATPSGCTQCQDHVGTIVHVAVNGTYAGHIVISDRIKADAAETIDGLKQLGVEKTVMLTGDREKVGRFVGEKLGIDEVDCELMPADKVERVKQYARRGASGGTLAFVGDGINDAPVLALADVGIAMGALGSDAAIEAADVVLMDDKPSKIVQAIRQARRTVAIAAQNARFAIGVKVAILLLVATGLPGSWAMGVAVFGDVGVMVLAVVNAMRAMRA